MTRPPVYTFQRGEPVTLSLDVVSGDPTGMSLAAALKPVDAGATTPPADTVPVAATFTTSLVAASGSDPARFLLSLTPAQSEALAEGRYMTDGKVSLSGTVVLRTDPALVELLGRVTP